MKYSSVPNLSAAVASAFLTLNTPTNAVWAQEVVADETRQAQSATNDNESAARYNFKPEICDSIDALVSADAKAIAMDEERYTAIHAWKDRTDAKDVFLYRLCKEDNIFEASSSVFSDVLWRLKDQDWYIETLMPFMEQDPAFLARVMESGHFYNREERKSKFVATYDWDNREEGITEDEIKVTYSAEQIHAVAKNSERAKYIFRNFDDLSLMPGVENVLKDALRNYPIALLTYPSIFAQYETISSEIDIGAYLLEEVKKGDRPRTFINNFDDYAHLPEAQEIVQTAIDNYPLAFFDIQRESGISSILQEDGFIHLPVSKLQELATYKNRARTLLASYEYYAHLPEARDIAQNAILTNSLYFIGAKNSGKLHPLLAGDDLLEISAASLMNSVQEGRTGGFYEYYDSYAHLPEAKDIIKAVILLKPIRYYERKAENNLPDSIVNLGVAPSIEDLWDFFERETSKEETHIHKRDLIALLKYYNEYSSFDGGNDFAQALIDYAPVTYFNALGSFRGAERYKDIIGSGLTPSTESLLEIANTPRTARYLFKMFQFYSSVDRAHEILQLAIQSDPIKFLYTQTSAEKFDYAREDFEPIKNLLDAGVIMPPTIDDIERYALNTENNVYFSDIARIYSDIQDNPKAWDILIHIIDQRPESALSSIMHNMAGQQLDDRHDFDRWRDQENNTHWPLPQETEKRQTLISAFSYLVKNHADIVIEKLRDSNYGYHKPLSLALSSEDEEIISFVFDELRNNPYGVLNTLSEPKQRSFFDSLTPDLQQELAIISKPAIDIMCAPDRDGRSYSTYAWDMRRIFSSNSWVSESGLYSQDNLARILGCFMQEDPELAISTLESNESFEDKTGINPASFSMLITEVIYKNPLYFLARTTKDEKTEDLVILGVRIPYENLLEKAQNYLAEEITKNSRHYNLLRHTISIANNLHDYPAQTRFALFDKLPEGAYIKLVTQEDSRYYTSSFNFIMDGFLREIQQNPEVLEQLWDDQRHRDSKLIHAVLENATQFGRLDEFLALLNEEESRLIINAVLDKLTKSKRDGYVYHSTKLAENSVLMAAAAEILIHIARQGNNEYIEQNLVDRFTHERDPQSRTTLGLAAALYSDQAEITTHIPFFAEVQNIYLSHMGRYMRTDMEADPLFDKQGRNYQMMVFYNDKDGHASFWHFKEKYNADRRWKYEDHGTFISYSRSGIQLFANKPDHELVGNRDIEAHVEEQGGTITFLAHRGHSYHVRKTADNYLNENIQFLWLGACRSSVIWNYIDDAPNMQFIYSSNVGTMRVNDPLLKNINDTLADRRNVNWVQMRDDAKRLSNYSKEADSYVFPDGSLEYALRMVQSLFNGDPRLARATQNEMLEAIYDNATYEVGDYVLNTNFLTGGDDNDEFNSHAPLTSLRPVVRPMTFN